MSGIVPRVLDGRNAKNENGTILRRFEVGNIESTLRSYRFLLITRRPIW